MHLGWLCSMEVLTAGPEFAAAAQEHPKVALGSTVSI